MSSEISTKKAYVLVEYLGEEEYKYSIEIMAEMANNAFFFKKNDRLYLRIPISLVSDYEFSVYTAGFQNIPYRLFLEIDYQAKTDIHPDPFQQDFLYKAIKGKSYGLITPGCVCSINGFDYRLDKIEKSKSSFYELYAFEYQ